MKNTPDSIKIIPRIVIGAAHSGAGKTTITLALMAALKKRGMIVQGFKCGPDYIDPGYHRAITGMVSHNLDSWFVKAPFVKNIFARYSLKADISIIEGVMGLYDGKNPSDNQGSTAEISYIINAPVILVLDARSMARSAAAIVRGFQVFSKKTNIAGVIVNKCGSQNHYNIIREAIEKECRIPVLGGFLRNEEIQIPERQLGLLPALERGELDPFFDKLTRLAEESLDIKKILSIAKSAGEVQTRNLPQKSKNFNDNVTVAIARDDAFNFYYPENLDLMQSTGMKLVYFSPLNNEPVPPEADGLYLGGGFPEEFAKTLSKNRLGMNSIKAAIENGIPCIAECGGFMVLTEELLDTRGKAYPMMGIIPGKVIMQSKLSALGYREITGLKNNYLLPDKDMIRGHEFHYSKYENLKMQSHNNTLPAPQENPELAPAYNIKGRNIDKTSGAIYKNLIAGYMHFYFLSNPSVVQRWRKKCQEYKSRRNQI